jgi:hypothetical protein
VTDDATILGDRATRVRLWGASVCWLLLAIGHIGITVLLAFLYARWWLTDVKDWHRAHRMIGH